MFRQVTVWRWLTIAIVGTMAISLWWQRLDPDSFQAMAGVSLTKNGFDLSQSLIAPEEIRRGGPPKDGIPALDRPRFVTATKAAFLAPEDRVLALVIDGISKAYPIKILNWHEIVNDHIANQAVAVTYCPLCGTGIAFDAEINGRAHSFGVSGLLYNSDVLLYDRETESLWSQILGKAISGRYRGKSLQPIPLEHTTWQDWWQRYPGTLVLSINTGFARDYNRDPYSGYERSRELYFSVSHKAPPRYHPKERVLGLDANGVFKAYPFVELNRYNRPVFQDRVNGQTYHIHWDPEHQTGRILDTDGQRISTVTGFWFAWFAFHPNTLVFSGTKEE
jgi:hypothetical protein